MNKKHFIALADALRLDYEAGRIPDAVLCTLIALLKGQFNRSITKEGSYGDKTETRKERGIKRVKGNT